MTNRPPALGDVWRYPYLWSREATQGESEGRKQRPVVLILLVQTPDGETEVLMVPITSAPQSSPFALPVPEIEKRRAGLDAHMPLWVVADEANADVPGKSFYFEPDNRLGGFSPTFTKQVQNTMIKAIRARTLKRTSRL